MCSLTLKKLAFTTVEVKKKIKHKTHRAQTHFKMQAFSQRQGDKGKIPKKKFSYYQLSDSQVSVLSKCLKLIPTSGTIECKIRPQLMRDFEQFARRMRLYVFHGKNKEPHPKSIEMSAIFELDAAWSYYYVHCTFCIALKLAPTTLRFKRSDIKIEYSKHKIDSPMRRTPASLLYSFYKVIICIYLI